MTDAAKEARREYMRKWREANRQSIREYMLAVRGYLLQMGEIEPDAQSLRQLAAEMEGECL